MPDLNFEQWQAQRDGIYQIAKNSPGFDLLAAMDVATDVAALWFGECPPAPSPMPDQVVDGVNLVDGGLGDEVVLCVEAKDKVLLPADMRLLADQLNAKADEKDGGA